MINIYYCYYHHHQYTY